MVLKANLVVFIEIVLFVDPQRVEDALKTRGKKKKSPVVFSYSCTGEIVPRGHLGTEGTSPHPLIPSSSLAGVQRDVAFTAECMETFSQGAEHRVA